MLRENKVESLLYYLNLLWSLYIDKALYINMVKLDTTLVYITQLQSCDLITSIISQKKRASTFRNFTLCL
jgi:hypothetical protein